MDVFDVRMPGVDPGTVLFTIDTHGNVTTYGTLATSNAAVLIDPTAQEIQVGAATASGNGTVHINALSATVALQIENGTDVVSRFVVKGDGSIELGAGGTSSRDVFLARGGAGLLTLSSSDFLIGTAGRGLQIKEGANARMGTLTLTGATPVVVANTSVTANTRIFLTANAAGGTPGHFWVSARSAGVSFSVTGTAGDTSTVAYLLVEPA